MPSYVHPLAWLLALEGVALLRTQAGDLGDEEYVARRIAEIRRLTADRDLACHEPRWGEVSGGHGGPLAQRWCPEAAAAAYHDTPAVIIWHLRRPQR
ncbi:hypothetical protein [Nonomuraea sp. NPDC049695]|uniref:hypothetical protein n=1 Tax=Nonomuraea sp. NPDC049695 TaxID=3154734 RepID=UPI00343EAD2C